MKILSPAGNFDSLKAAVYNGADEVYVGINSFNARNNIDGFDINTLKDAVVFAHIFGVKVHLAINILFDNTEIKQALDNIVTAYNYGVDAFIIQDIGLISLVKQHYPNIPVHASTQMGLHNYEGIKALEKYNIERVVLARETPFDEIKRINNNSNVELEYFAQGALCVAFSGNCYLSSYLCDASGNRGKCKQLCRLTYTLQHNNKNIKTGYLLSAKDFCMIDKLALLQQCGIDAIKIEGRARRPYYVATTTKQYYNAINNLPYDIDHIKLGFNRNYTRGYFDGNDKIISTYNNHIGICVGKITKVVGGKTFSEVYFSSNRLLTPKSTFKLYDQDTERSTLTAYDLKKVDKNIYKLTTTQKACVGDNIHLILDAELEQQTLLTTKKRNIDITLSLQADKPIQATVNINNQTLTITGDICAPAQKQPITLEDLQKNFNKHELFVGNITIGKLDNVFMPKQQLNNFRREVFDKIYSTFLLPAHNEKLTIIQKGYKAKVFDNFVFVTDIEQNFEKDNVIFSPEVYTLQDVQAFVDKCKTLNKTPYLDTPNFALQKDIQLLKDIIDKTNIAIVANNYYATTLTDNYIVGGGLNIYNDYAASVYDKPVIFAEGELKHNFAYMTLRHCPLKNHLCATCDKCPYDGNYTYRMDNGKILKLRRKKLSTCTFYLTD